MSSVLPEKKEAKTDEIFIIPPHDDGMASAYEQKLQPFFPDPAAQSITALPRAALLKRIQDKSLEFSFDLPLFFRELKTQELGQTLLYCERVSSTQVILNEKFGGIQMPLLFTTSQQVAGKGRGTNTWESPAGCLMFSFKCQSAIAERLPFFQYLVSLTMVDAVHSINSDIDVRLKWPNDIYAGKNVKIGGVLCQSSYMNRTFDIVTGLGLNVDNEQPTTCLNKLVRESSNPDGPKFTREALLANFCAFFEKHLPVFEREGFQPFLERYLKFWNHSDQHVTVANADGSSRELVIKGLTPTGFLRADDATGTIFELHPDGNSFDFLKGLIVHKQL